MLLLSLPGVYPTFVDGAFSVYAQKLTGGLKHFVNTDWFRFSKRTRVDLIKWCSSCMFKSWCDRLQNRQFPSPLIVNTFPNGGADRICVHMGMSSCMLKRLVWSLIFYICILLFSLFPAIKCFHGLRVQLLFTSCTINHILCICMLHIPSWLACSVSEYVTSSGPPLPSSPIYSLNSFLTSSGSLASSLYKTNSGSSQQSMPYHTLWACLDYMVNTHYDSIVTTTTGRPSQEHIPTTIHMTDMVLWGVSGSVYKSCNRATMYKWYTHGRSSDSSWFSQASGAAVHVRPVAARARLHAA